jgi:signal peptidase
MSRQALLFLPRSRKSLSRVLPRVVMRWAWIGVLVWLAAIYLFVNFWLPGKVSPALEMYLVQPLLWSSLALLSFLGWRYGLEERPSLNKYLVGVAALTGLSQIALFVIAGLLFGFGNSPYSHRPLALLANFVFAGSLLVGLEMSRAYLATVFGKRSPVLALILVLFIFSLVNIPPSRFQSLDDTGSVLRLFGSTVLPVIAENALASFLVLIGGPVASLAYLGTLRAFEWLSPILPSLRWLLTAFLGTLVPACGLLLVRSYFAGESRAKEDEQPKETRSSSAWLAVAAAAVAILWFNTGLFGVRPTLISGVSMSPALMPGDVVITRDVPADAVEVGDIIRFRQEDIYVLHRVIEIEKDRGRVRFITRGDYNNVNDPPVDVRELEGEVVLIVPKIGWVAIGLRRLIEWIGAAL